MYQKWFLFGGTVGLFILSLLDKLAFDHYLYWRFPWFDIVMHLIGGVAIGLVSIYFYWEWQKRKFAKNPDEENSNLIDRKLYYLYNLGFILVVGLGWEIFEILIDRITRFNLENVLKDLLFGIIGSLSVGIFVLW